MQNPIPPDLTFGITVIVLTLIGVAALSFEGMLALTIGGSIIIFVAFSKLSGSNYKDSPVLTQIAKFSGYKVHKCGCVYEKDYSHYSTNIPESEWMDQEKVYERSMEGAKIRFDKKKSGMKRCTECGNHYHTVESISSNRCKHRRICWPEEEPDVREELDHRVIEA